MIIVCLTGGQDKSFTTTTTTANTTSTTITTTTPTRTPTKNCMFDWRTEYIIYQTRSHYNNERGG